MERLSASGRWTRVVVTVAAAALLLAGTLWGEDDHFPFGPFRMYSTAADPDSPVRDTRVEAVDSDGQTVELTPANTGIRRAEFEGQLARFRQQPELLQLAIEAYEQRNPSAPELVEVHLVIRWHEVRDFEVTGEWEEEVVASWQP